MCVIGLPLLHDLASVRNVASLIFPNPIWLNLPPTRWLRNPSSIICGRTAPSFLALHLRLYRKLGPEKPGRSPGFQSNTLRAFVLHLEVQVITCSSAQGSVLSSLTAAWAFRCAGNTQPAILMWGPDTSGLLCVNLLNRRTYIDGTSPLNSYPKFYSQELSLTTTTNPARPRPPAIFSLSFFFQGKCISVLCPQQRSGWRCSSGQN